MNQIKDSQQMLDFLNNLSKFTQTFSNLKTEQAPPPKKAPPSQEERCEEKENPRSPTKGIADEFIQNILDSYLKKT